LTGEGGAMPSYNIARKFFISIIAIVISTIIAFTLGGCSSKSNFNQEINSTARFESIDSNHVKIMKFELIYDVETRIVYMISYSGSGITSAMGITPYIGENGNYCRYINGEIEEIY